MFNVKKGCVSVSARTPVSSSRLTAFTQPFFILTKLLSSEDKRPQDPTVQGRNIAKEYQPKKGLQIWKSARETWWDKIMDCGSWWDISLKITNRLLNIKTKIRGFVQIGADEQRTLPSRKRAAEWQGIDFGHPINGANSERNDREIPLTKCQPRTYIRIKNG